MGDIADMMADGDLCAGCGVFIDDEEEGYAGACGHPRYCRGCGGVPGLNGMRPEHGRRDAKPGKKQG